jgi:hypothetical protein
MRGDGTDGIKRRAWTTDKAVLNREDNFRDYAEVAADEEVIDPDNGTCEGVFDGSKNSIGQTFLDGTKSRIKSGARHRSDTWTEKLKRRFFTESAWLALKRNAHFMDDSIPCQGDGERRFS